MGYIVLSLSTVSSLICLIASAGIVVKCLFQVWLLLHLDYCDTEEFYFLDGFNCLPEGYCLLQEFVCDGVPDCVSGLIALDEVDCDGKPCCKADK